MFASLTVLFFLAASFSSLRQVSAVDVNICEYIGGSVHVHITTTIKRNADFTDEWLDVLNKRTLKIDQKAGGKKKWVMFKPEPIKKSLFKRNGQTYIDFRGRIIDENDEQHFTDILKKTNIDLHGWAGIIKCDLEKKESVVQKVRSKHTTRVAVTMLVIAYPCESKTECVLLPEIVQDLKKFKSEFNS